MITKLKSLILGFTVLIAIQLVANLVLKYLNIPFPSPLFGMLLLFVLLYFKIIPEKFIKDIADLLLSNMSLFFIPLFVGIITYIDLIRDNFLPIVMAVVVVTFTTMVLTALFVEFVIKCTQGKSCDD